MIPFHTLVCATRCGYTWVEDVQKFVRFLFRKDGNYDVSLLREADVPTAHATVVTQERLLSQHRHLHLDVDTANRLLAYHRAVWAEIREGAYQLVLSPTGEPLDLPCERRMVGL